MESHQSQRNAIRSRLRLVLLSLLLVGLPGLAQPLAAQEIGIATNRAYHGSEPVAAGGTTLDLYFPKGETSDLLPILIFVHGGGWRVGSKEAHALKSRHFAARGFLVASVDYRLHPAVEVADQAQDVARAVSWVARNAATYDADPSRVFLMGHSAGAHLAALVAVDPSYFETARFPRENLRGVVLLDGAGYDLLQTQEGPRVRQLYETVFGTDPQALRELSPVHQITSDAPPPPFLILHVPRAASRVASEALARRLRAVGGDAEVVETPDKTHQTLNRELGLPSDAPTALVDRFVGDLSARP